MEALSHKISGQGSFRSREQGASIVFYFLLQAFSFSGENKAAGKLKFKEFPQVEGNDILDVVVTSENRLALATNGKGFLLADLNEKGN